MPAWLVIDQRYRNRYLFAGLSPRQPFPGRWYKHGTVKKADTLEALAAEIGVPAAALSETVVRFNGFARTGVDADFHRGESAYDKYYSDPTVKPNPSLHSIDQGPFYAVKIVPGDLGTKGGLVTDERARVLRPDGSVIDGLYAAGNVSAAVMGHTYAGPGATIGPALVFGYLAAEDIAATRSAGKPSRRQRRRGELMPIDPDVAIGAQLPDRTFSWESSDVLLYHLGIGAGSRPGDNLDSAALRYTLDDDDLQVLPSFGIVAPTFHETDPPPLDLPGCDINLSQVVHGSQQIEVAAPLPTERVGHPAHADQRRLGQGQGGRHLAGGPGALRGGRAALDRPLLDLRARRGRLGWRPRVVGEGGDPRPGARLRRVVRRDAAAGAALPPLRRPQPAARRPGLRGGGRLPGADPARPLLLRHRAAHGHRRAVRRRGRPRSRASTRGSPGSSSRARPSGCGAGTPTRGSWSPPPIAARASATALRCSPTAWSRPA